MFGLFTKLLINIQNSEEINQEIDHLVDVINLIILENLPTYYYKSISLFSGRRSTIAMDIFEQHQGTHILQVKFYNNQ